MIDISFRNPGDVNPDDEYWEMSGAPMVWYAWEERIQREVLLYMPGGPEMPSHP